MGEEPVLVEKEGPVAIVTLNRPEAMNSLNAALRRQLVETISALDADPEIRVVIVKGAGRGFCAGADLAETPAESIEAQLETEYRPILTGIAQSPKIWIASVHGSAAGIGGAIAMVCDLVVMAENANIYMAFAAIGLVPDGGATWQLARAMGPRKALEAILEGQKISASKCLEAGLANRISGDDSVHDDALAWGRQLALGAPLAMAAAKRLVRSGSEVDYSTAFSLEATEQQPLIQSDDFREGVAAFFKKEKPVFRGS